MSEAPGMELALPEPGDVEHVAEGELYEPGDVEVIVDAEVLPDDPLAPPEALTDTEVTLAGGGMSPIKGDGIDKGNPSGGAPARKPKAKRGTGGGGGSGISVSIFGGVTFSPFSGNAVVKQAPRTGTGINIGNGRPSAGGRIAARRGKR